MDKSSFEKEVLHKVELNYLAVAYQHAVLNRQALVENLTMANRNDILLLHALAIHVRSYTDTVAFDSINKYQHVGNRLVKWWEDTNILLTKLNDINLKIREVGTFKQYLNYLGRQ
jgi:hypothetical protein